MKLTKREVRHALRLRDGQLARLLGVGKGAVSMWPDDQPIPDGRQWQLRALFPEQFPLPAEFAARRENLTRQQAAA
jgi:hypothetical protein